MPGASDAAIRKLEELMSRDPLLRDVFARSLPRTKGGGGRFVPDVDVLDLDDSYVITLELPGVPRDRIQVELEGTRLVVSGDKPIVRPSGAEARVSERQGGPFKREFLVPWTVIAEDVRARLDAGVLTITLPRREQAGRYQVEVD